MNPVQCLNGHFFDEDKYETCPLCGAEAANEEQLHSEEKQFGFKRKGKRKNDKKTEETLDLDGNNNNLPPYFDDDDKTVVLDQNQLDSYNDPYINNSESNIDNPEKENSETSLESEYVYYKEPQLPIDESVYDIVYGSENKQSLKSEIKSISSNNFGKTTGIFFSGHSNAENEPVVGWIVCVKGDHFGESFTLAEGRNSVGRNDNNDVVLYKDESVSREKHLWITFDPKKREFYAQPGEGRGLSYLNDENILEPKIVHAYDKFEIGKGLYVFVPFCCDQFSWEDYLNK